MHGDGKSVKLADVQAAGVWFKATAGEIFAARKQYFAKGSLRHIPVLRQVPLRSAQSDKSGHWQELISVL